MNKDKLVDILKTNYKTEELPSPSEMLVEAFREFNSSLQTLNDVLGVVVEKQSELAENLNQYQAEIDKTIWKKN